MTAPEFNNQLLKIVPTMERFALKQTFNRDDAKDLLQETLLKVLTHREQYVEINNFKAWTFTIMRNSFINEYRKSVLKKTWFDHTREGFFQNNSAWHHDIEPEPDMACSEIDRAIEELDDDFKIPFRMVIAGYRYKEIAGVLHLNMGTVKSRIFLCRKKLSKTLHDYRFG